MRRSADGNDPDQARTGMFHMGLGSDDIALALAGYQGKQRLEQLVTSQELVNKVKLEYVEVGD